MEVINGGVESGGIYEGSFIEDSIVSLEFELLLKIKWLALAEVIVRTERECLVLEL